jgi:hypothetical protein
MKITASNIVRCYPVWLKIVMLFAVSGVLGMTAIAGSGPIQVYGSQCMTCTAPTLGANGQTTLNCTNFGGGQQQNTLSYVAGSQSIVVNGNAYNCGIGNTPPGYTCSPPPASASQLPWVTADNNNGTLVNISCNTPSPLQLYGGQCGNCATPTAAANGPLNINCTTNSNTQQANTIIYDANAPRLIVNNTAYLCSTETAPLSSAGPACGQAPANAGAVPWLSADNNNGTLTNIGCNIPISEPVAMVWQKSPGVAQYAGADWSKLVEIKPNMTPASAQAYAADKDYINFFFYVNTNFNLGGNANQTFNAGDAVFFSGTAWGGQAPADTYAKQPSSLITNLGNGLAAYYSFNINTNDNSTAGNNAAPSGNLGYQVGYLGNAIGFAAGSNAQVTFPSTLEVAQSSFSISTWVWADGGGTPATGLASIVGPLYLDVATNQLVYRVVASGANPQVDVRSAAAIDTGEWVNVAVSANATTGVVDLYVNGALTASSVVPQLASYTDIPWGSSIGGPASASVPAFIGAVDEMYLYTRPLSRSEIVYLGRFAETDSHDRHAHPQSVDTAGEPGYPSKKVCTEHMFAPPLFWGVGDYACTNWGYKCNDSESTSFHSHTCACPTGTTVINGGGCQAVPTKKTAALSVIPPSGSNLQYVANITNASWAAFDLTNRDAFLRRSLVENFDKTYCDAKNPTPIQNGCSAFAQYLIDSDNGAAPSDCKDLALVKTDGTAVNYANYTLAEWANLYVQSLTGDIKQKPFVMLNSNFWDPGIAPNNNPCGLPYGILQRNGQLSTVNSANYDSFTITNTNGKNAFAFTLKGTAATPSTGAYTISGYLIRDKGKDIKTANGTGKFAQAKPGKCAARTAIAYSSSADQLQVLVIPGSTQKAIGSCTKGRMKVADVRNYFNNQKDGNGKSLFDEILVLDGGGSSSLVYWNNGAQVYSAPEEMRNIPTALIIRQP